MKKETTIQVGKEVNKKGEITISFLIDGEKPDPRTFYPLTFFNFRI